MRTIMLLWVGFLFSTAAFAQTKKPAAAKSLPVESLYQQALKLYAEDDFKSCLSKIDRAETVSAQASAKLLYLKTKTLAQLCQTDNQYCLSFSQAYEAFIQVAPLQKYSADKIEEIRQLEPRVQQINSVKLAETQRLATVQDSIQAATEREAKVNAMYEQALLLYAAENWTECATLLAQADLIQTEPNAKLSYLNIKSLYALFQRSPTNRSALETAFSAFDQVSKTRPLSTEQQEEIRTLQNQFTERVQQIEAEKALKAKITQMYQQAEQFYEDDQLTECIGQLDQLEAFLGSPNGKTLYLKIKALYPLSRQDAKYSTALEKAFPLFFEVAKQQNYSSLKIKEISSFQLRMAADSKSEKAKEENNEAEIPNLVEQTMELIYGGSYKMGSTGPIVADDEKPLHKITLSNFYLSKFEMTQDLWLKVMGNNPSGHKNCLECPVETVSWDQIQEFIKKLNKKTGRTYRLPTEAEWEYVRKGGQKSNGTFYAGSNNIEKSSWTKPNSGGTTHPVGQKMPNELGIYDMVGNVTEWVQDGYNNNYFKKSPKLNPVNLTDTNRRVIRGFSYFNDVSDKNNEILLDFGTVEINRRLNLAPTSSNDTTGFRLARSE